MALRATKGDEDAAGGIVYFRRSFAASSTERITRLSHEIPKTVKHPPQYKG